MTLLRAFAILVVVLVFMAGCSLALGVSGGHQSVSHGTPAPIVERSNAPRSIGP